MAETMATMLVLTNARLIDGTGREPVENATVVIAGDRIVELGRQERYGKGTTVIDLEGSSVLPGLIDCHLHLGGFVIDEPGRLVGEFHLRDSLSFMLDYWRDFARRRKLAIENGVTTIRSAGDNYPHITKLRDKITAGKLTGPRIFAAGPVFTAPGGHPAGTIYKRNRYIVEHATRQVSNTMGAREEVKKLAEGGVDCIKAVYSKTNPMDLGHEVPQLALDVLRAIVDEAHMHDLRMMVHTGNPNETRDAVGAGADSIEHGILPGANCSEFAADVIELMLEGGTYYVPTLAIAWANRNTYPDLFSDSMKALKQLHDAGVNVALGTDSGAPGVVIGKAVHTELQLMVEAGLSPMEAIIAATKRAAENLGKQSELGTIEEGKLADVIVVSADPLRSIANTASLTLVVKGGRIVLNRRFSVKRPG